MDQTSVSHGCYPCGRRSRPAGRESTYLAPGAGAAGQTAGPEAASEHEWTDSTASGSESGDGKAGDRLPRLRLRAQQLATRKAKALYDIARSNRELAEIAIEEYEEITYPKDLATVAGEIRLAESDMTRSQDRLDWARRMFDKGYVSDATKKSEELARKKAQFASSRPRASEKSWRITPRAKP